MFEERGESFLKTLAFVNASAREYSDVSSSGQHGAEDKLRALSEVPRKYESIASGEFRLRAMLRRSQRVSARVSAAASSCDFDPSYS
jgi:hypothetical protein